MSRPFQDYEVHLKDYLYILRKRRKAILIFFGVVLLSSITLTCFEKVLYRGSVTILIERNNPNVVDFKEVMALDSASTDYYQTQYQMFKSRTLIDKLIEKENLAEDPYIQSLVHSKVRSFLRNLSLSSPWFREFLSEPTIEDVFVRKMLRIDPVRNSQLVEISVLHPDAKRAADIANSLADLFIQRSLEDRFMISKQATDLISKQLVELKDKVGVADRALQKYKEDHALVTIPSIREKNEFLQDAKLELVKTQAEEAKLAKRYLPAHPKRIHIQSQIDGLKEKIAEEENKILGLGRVAIDYGELEREAESSRQIYEALLNRLQETNSEAQTQASNMIIVDRAKPAMVPYKPQPILNILMGLFIGAIGGILLAFFLEYLDSTLSIPDDVEKGLGLDLFGIIPESPMDEKEPFAGQLFLSGEKHSPTAESIRALRTVLLFHLRQITGCRTILVSSPNPSEGKTTIAFNLASAFQQNHLKVLLIDGDLRKPQLHKILGVPSEKGLTDMLEGESSFAETVAANVGGLGFDFISAGSHSHHPTELLGTSKMRTLMAVLEKNYDIIILDSPPYLAVADVFVLNEWASGVVIVTRYHKTEKRQLRNLKRRFNVTGNKIFGLIMNRVSVREKDYYYHQYYYYGYGEAKPGG
mgnify:CR=1 FL=1